MLHYLHDIAREIKLVDHPSERKLHASSVPLVGGVSIVISFFLALLLSPFGLGDFRFLMVGMSVMLIVGVLDDHQDLPAVVKIAAQFLVALALVKSGSVVTGVGDIFAWQDGNHQGLGFLAEPLTAVGIVGIMNAYNFIDGLDGLAATLFILSCLILIGVTIEEDLEKHQFLLMLFLSTVIVFWCFNLSIFVGSDKKVFLGDAGSMIFGLVLVYFLIDLTEPRGARWLMTTTAPWIVGLPLFDMFSVIILRSARRSPLSRPDRLHLHHVLEDLNLSKPRVLCILMALHIAFMGVGLYGQFGGLPEALLFWSVIPVIAIYAFLVNTLQKKVYT